MSSSITSPALSVLQSLNAGSSDLISIINGGGATTGGDPVAALTLAETNETKAVAQQANQPQTKAEISRFLAVVAKAKDIGTVLADPIARKVFLTANGLGDQVDYPALATKALSSDLTKTNNLASQLSNAAWKNTVTEFDFAHKGLSVLKQQSVLNTITNGYAQVVWGEAQDATTPGLSAALDFRTRANTIKTVDDILGDANFRTVVTGALSIPQQIAFQPLATQEKAISNRLDLTRLKDPKFVEQLAREFLINNQSSDIGSSTGANSLVSLFT